MENKKALTVAVILLLVLVYFVGKRQGLQSQEVVVSYQTNLISALNEYEASLHNSIPEQALEATVGAKAVVPNWTWVDPINDEVGYSCGVERGGIVSVVEKKADTVLLVYTPPTGYTAGTPCDLGIRFYTTEAGFLSLTASYIEIRNKILHDNAVVRELLAGSVNGRALSTKDVGWVDVVNPTPIASGNSEFVYGDSCIPDKQGHMRSKGERDGRTLYEYSMPSSLGTAYGTGCPSGTLFFQ